MIKGWLRVAALGIAAVHQDIYAAAVIRVCLNQMTGAGYALFSANVGDLWWHYPHARKAGPGLSQHVIDPECTPCFGTGV